MQDGAANQWRFQGCVAERELGADLPEESLSYFHSNLNTFGVGNRIQRLPQHPRHVLSDPIGGISRSKCLLFDEARVNLAQLCLYRCVNHGFVKAWGKIVAHLESVSG